MLILSVDVLMVWHTHMLNPRYYLEDAMRQGLGRFWAGGIPWEIVDRYINEDFMYDPPAQTKTAWTVLTGLSWDNTDDPAYTQIPCPICKTEMSVPWTTCGSIDMDRPTDMPSLSDRLQIIGSGYGDGGFKKRCSNCNLMTDADLLCVAKLAQDAENLVEHHQPMPGTILGPVTGMPEPHYGSSIVKSRAALTSVNRLTHFVLSPHLRSMTMQWRALHSKPRMNTIRKQIIKALEDDNVLSIMANDADARHYTPSGDKGIDEISSKPTITLLGSGVKRKLTQKTSTVMRKFISYYSGSNWSMFGLDLRGAVIRQADFIDKMYKVGAFTQGKL